MTMDDTEPRAAIVSTVKAPLDQLLTWVGHHRRVGFERFFLFFDDPDDRAIAPVGALPGVQAVPCGPGWWSGEESGRPPQLVARQRVNLHRGMEAAREAGQHWVAHIDADELVRPLRPLPALLSGQLADALRLDLREAVSERTDYASIFDARTFKVPPGRLQHAAARLLGCRRAIRHGDFFRGHRESKTLVRLGGRVRRMGIHKPLECEAGARIEWTDEIQLLHFDCIGFEDWNAKWSDRLNGDSFGRGIRPARQAQFADYVDAARQGLEARRELFRETQMIPSREAAILHRLGLLETIDLDRTKINGD